MSETDAVRDRLLQNTEGLGCDIGFGGSALTKNCLTFDMPRAYTVTGNDRQILKGDCRDLSFFFDESLCWIYSSHLLEDFTYTELPSILREWRRVLRPRGLMITACPDQQKFLSHCARTGQGTNMAHKESSFSLANFKQKVADPTGPWETVMEDDNVGPYSWILILRKL